MLKFEHFIYKAVLKITIKTHLDRKMSDENYLKLIFGVMHQQKLNLNAPKTFNEKLQWLKLYDRNPIYTSMVDKYEAKKFVAEKIGEEYIIPTLGIWDHFEEIDFSSLPNSFVLKTTHDSGGVVIVKDKASLDMDAARKKINDSLQNNYYWNGREWPYKNVKPRIIAEKYMVDESGYELKDYKFFCFDGFAKAMFIATDRQIDGEETKFDFYDMDFKHLPFTNGHPNSGKEIKRPKAFDEMKELAGKLSEGVPQVRVDFYEVEGKIYFGELTLSHWSGFVPFEPKEWDYKFGEWIKLPDSFGGGYLIASSGYILWVHIKPQSLVDYKIMCFNGQPSVILVCNNRFSENGLCEDFFDTDWNKLELLRPNHRHFSGAIPKPENFELMKKLATQLSDGTKFLRVDFYEINGHVYFGELTFYPASGFEQFVPAKWDLTLGHMLDLNAEI